MIESNKNEVKTATLDKPYDAEKSAVDKTYQSLSTRPGNKLMELVVEVKAMSAACML